MNKAMAILAIAVLFFLGMIIVPSTSSTPPDFYWAEEFDYDSLDQMRSAGWTLEQPTSTSLNSSAVVLNGMSVDTVIRYRGFPEGIIDWVATSRGMWAGGDGGAIIIAVVTSEHSYSFWIDGWYGNLMFSVDGTGTIIGSYALDLFIWHELEMHKVGNKISCYLDGVFSYTAELGEEVGEAVGMDIVSPWHGIAQYDRIEITSAPRVVWQNTYGGSGSQVLYSVANSPDGGYLFLGGAESTGGYDAYLVKTDVNGQEQWSRNYDESSGDYAYRIIATEDGGYIFVGGVMNTTIADFRAWLVKLDAEGDLEWSAQYGNGSRDAAFCVIQTDDGGYAITGYKGVVGGVSDVYLIKIDSEGNEEWQRTYGGMGNDWGKDLIQTRDGGYAIAGWSTSFDTGALAYMIRTDESGEMLWDLTMGGVESYGYGILETENEDLVLSGHTNSMGNGSFDFYSARVDVGGNMVWERTFGGSGDDRGFSVLPTDDGFIFGGWGNSYHSDMTRLMAVGTDGDGNVLWQGVYGPNVRVEGSLQLIAADGGFIAAGFTNTYRSGSDDGYAIKVAGNVVPSDDDAVDLGAVVNPLLAVGLGTGLAFVGAAAVAGLGSASGGASAQATISGTRSTALARPPWSNKLFDFLSGYGKFHLRIWLYGKESKLRKVRAVEAEPFLFGISKKELGVIALTAILLGSAFMLAKRMDLAQPLTWVTFIGVAGFAIMVHDLTHRYNARKHGTVAEYKFWGLGAVIMFVTAIIFGTIYAFPSRTIVNDPGKLSLKERAIIYGSGPLLSFGVFLFFLMLTPIGGTVTTIALLACSMNLLTAVYSFMPFVPMDGSHVMKWKRPVWALIFLPMLALYIVMTVFVF